MSTYTLHSLQDFARMFARDTRAREQRLKTALRKAGRYARGEAIRNVPKAFEELADSIHLVENPGHVQVIADAPHAAAVENGSRPHTPPLDPLIKWVKLRGMQGLTKSGNVISNRTKTGIVKNTNLEAARVVALSIRKLERKSGSGSRYSGIDAAVQVARAIQYSISKNGTKPHHYMSDVVPGVVDFLQMVVPEVMKDQT